ncbi:transcription factor grauzone isoform X2 [Eupeodes corollae]|uniref:transcription factor grauzone isoform X2 n=1 Tax=Eupeodes corollae TaxID=290404 RepID=UPI0024904D7E|nr:transcription factor grauzone isoform X2 [Eupeodes corollae]
MICRLCLKDILEVINIFDEIGIELNVVGILKKYFWFEPKIDDPISTAICNDCWLRVVNFHEYYLSVEEAHRLLAERFFVKASSPLLVNDVIDDENIEKDGENSSDLKDGDVNKHLQWDVQEVNFSYPLIEDEKPEGSEFSPSDDIFIEELEDTKEDVKDVDIKPQTEELISTNQRCLSLRTRTISNVKLSPDTSSAQNKTRRKQEKKSPTERSLEKESKYNIRAKEYDELIAKHMKLACEICHVELIDFTSLRQHFWNSHGQKGYIVCCNKKLFKRVLLVDHINKHLDPEYFKCQSCNKVFADKQCLKNHMLIIHQADEEKPFQCESCSKRFIKQYLLEQHQVIHVPLEERKFPCDFCPKVFPSENTLNTHRKNTHLQENGRMCHICAKVIRGRAMFEKHQLEHNGVKQPEIQCEKCGSWLKNKHSLQKHLRRHNEEGKMYTCNICGKVAPNQSALRSHIRYVHASERTYACSVCDKSFKKPLNLKEHMTTHTGEVLYSCPHCPKTFNSNANMHSHRKKIHPREWEANRKHRKGKVAGISSTVQKTQTTDDEVMPEDENTES